MELELYAYTDGGCSGNPGIGGWGVSLQAYQNGKLVKQRDLCGSSEYTTNNRMELQAVIEAIRALTKPSEITIVTDSKYVHDGVTKWIWGWRRNDWKTASKKDVKNKDLWLELDRIKSDHRVNWKWTKGHADSPGNNRADELASKAIKKLKEPLKAQS